MNTRLREVPSLLHHGHHFQDYTLYLYRKKHYARSHESLPTEGLMPPIILALLCWLPIATATLAATVYKCQQGSQTHYSDKPCSNQPRAIQLAKSPEAESSSYTAPSLTKLADQRLKNELTVAQAQRQHNEKQWAESERIQRLYRQKRVGTGMDSAMVRRLRGNPELIRYGADQQGEWELWSYRRDNQQIDQVKFREGKVVSAH